MLQRYTQHTPKLLGEKYIKTRPLQKHPNSKHTAMKLWRILNIGFKRIKHLDESEITSICFYGSGDWRLFRIQLQDELMGDRHC